MSILAKKLRNLKDYRDIPDKETKDRIIVEYAPLVKYLAQKISYRLPANIELDDLISCGVIGLMDAISKFDSSRDNKFKTYAEFRIRGAMLDELRAQDWIPRSIREKSKQVEKAYAKIETKVGREVTDEEMCEELECSQDEFHQILGKIRPVSVLNIDEANIFSRNDKKLLAGVVSEDKVNNPFYAVNNKILKKKIKDGIKELPEKQRLVLSLYYFEDLNLKEIGQVLDVTESRISQLHTQAIIKLKIKIKSSVESIDDIAS